MSEDFIEKEKKEKGANGLEKKHEFKSMQKGSAFFVISATTGREAKVHSSDVCTSSRPAVCNSHHKFIRSSAALSASKMFPYAGY